MTPPLPTATYRLQLREGMDFERAATLAPYVARLGCSHLYLSPIFTAAPGSTHGYDVTDPTEIDPALGGRAGFEGLAAACRAAGLGIVLDIVPNHTAFALENPWLRDVLRHGRASAYAGHFDIFWDAPGLGGRLRLPWLGRPFEAALEAGEIAVGEDADGPVLEAGVRVPLRGEVPQAARDGDRAALRALHDAQPWRVTWWRTEAAAITHRRFFTVTGLIGMRVEEERVFEDMHALTVRLVEDGLVQGLRVDHVDGLADPAAYLARLRDRLPATPVWIEKILTGEEYPPAEWPVMGTTGYVAARRIAQALTSPEGAQTLRQHLARDTGAAEAYRPMLAEAKRQVVEQELAAELDQLTGMACEAPGEWGREAVRAAILAYLLAFPRYRSYATDGVDEADAALIRGTVEAAARGLAHPGALPWLGALLLSPEGRALRTRMQQVTGAAIAKAQEDTAFYRDAALLSANEVGAEPDEPALDAPAFHEAMARRARLMPHGLTLTSSHDTKRAEDARARIMALSHDPAARDALLALVPEDCPVAWRWYLAQSAFAAAPGGDLADRLEAHVEKAAREAKRDTSWTAPVAGFEGRLREAARATAEAMDPLPEALRAVAARAEGLALAQCALKLLGPGIPDIYQGTEIGSWLLTDPDNRRPPDFVGLAEALGAPARLTPFDRDKLSLTATGLRLRREMTEVFAQAAYASKPAAPGRIAFARGRPGRGVRVEVTQDGTALEAGGGLWPGDGKPRSVRLDAL
jgi:(1->4)-alpha-D-glucan 1-alpha-D-glucosylmutase